MAKLYNLDSISGRMRIVRCRVDDLLAREELPPERGERDEALAEAHLIRLLMQPREAAINAIVHGNEEDPGKRITVVLRWVSGCFQASINDQGGGFEPADVPDPTSGAGLMTDSGRGLLMIRAYVDRVDFRPGKNGGTEIYLEKVFA